MTIALFEAEAIGEEFRGEVQVHLCLRHEIYIYAIGLTGPERVISFVGAGLSLGKGGFRFVLKDCPELQFDNIKKTDPVTIHPQPGGYHSFKHHLGYDSWHLLAYSKHSNFLFSQDDQTLWNMLHSPKFTTPILRHWVPELRREMREVGLMKDCIGFGGEAQIVFASSDTLDKLVTAGIRGGQLTFQAGREPLPSPGRHKPVGTFCIRPNWSLEK